MDSLKYTEDKVAIGDTTNTWKTVEDIAWTAIESTDVPAKGDSESRRKATDDDDKADDVPNDTKEKSVEASNNGKLDVSTGSDTSTVVKHPECTGDYVANTVERAEHLTIGNYRSGLSYIDNHPAEEQKQARVDRKEPYHHKKASRHRKDTIVSPTTRRNP